jgi:hypothetical protein
MRQEFLNLAAVPPAWEVVQTEAGPIYVHAMTAGEKDRFDLDHARSNGQHFRARLVMSTARDGSGAMVFVPEDLPALSAAPLALVEPLCTAAIRVNRMSDDAKDAVEKN